MMVVHANGSYCKIQRDDVSTTSRVGNRFSRHYSIHPGVVTFYIHYRVFKILTDIFVLKMACGHAWKRGGIWSSDSQEILIFEENLCNFEGKCIILDG